MGAPSFACVGESMAQFVPKPLGRLRDAEQLLVGFAGAESNVAIALARLGFSVQWVSRLGDDPFGDRIYDALVSEGVGLRHVERDPLRPTGVYFKDFERGSTRVLYYRAGSAAASLGSEILHDLDSVTAIHTTGITAALSESAYEMVRQALRTRPNASATYSFDVNYRPALMPDPSGWMRELAEHADVVFVGLDEAEALWSVTTAAEVRRMLPQPTHVIVKDSDRGPTAFVRDECYRIEIQPIEAIEPVGAGDSFAAGYLAGQAIGLSPTASLGIGHELAKAALMTTADVGETPRHIRDIFDRELSK